MSLGRKITWISLIVLAAGIKILSWYPGAVEAGYSRGIYPVIARLQRVLFGWIPFSIGDIFYLAALIYLLYGLLRLIRRLIRREVGREWLLRCTRQIVFVLLWVYVLFNGLWGLNYNRLGIAEQLGLEVRPYSTAELSDLTGVIVDQLNDMYTLSTTHPADISHNSSLRAGAVRAYDSLASRDSRFAYHSPSVKTSLFSIPGAYIGFGGYYNPFSGEAQVNTVNPLFTQPYTTCHEIGHQLGYAKENEANFIGFLAARNSPDPAFQYSVYFDMYLYSIRELYVRDSSLAKSLRARLNPGIRQDVLALQRFNRRYANPLEPYIWRLYGRYLRANQQPHGIVTYSEVTAWLIAYAKKNGRTAVEAGRVDRF